MNSLLEEAKVTRVKNAVAAGQTDQNSDEIDMTGFDSVQFIALFGALDATAVTGMKIQQDTVTGMGSAADLEGTALALDPDADDNKVLASDIIRPAERFVRAVVTRGTADAVIDGILAIQYKARTHAVTQDSSVAASETHVTPAEGTA